MVFRNTSSSTDCARGDDDAGVGHLWSLTADDPARELGVFEEIVAAFAGNSRCKL